VSIVPSPDQIKILVMDDSRVEIRQMEASLHTEEYKVVCTAQEAANRKEE